MSKASFYDQDEIPVYDAHCSQKYTFSGKRVKRGLYRTKGEHLVSSDINGSANILTKGMHRLPRTRLVGSPDKREMSVWERVSSGFLANPLRITIS